MHNIYRALGVIDRCHYNHTPNCALLGSLAATGPFWCSECIRVRCRFFLPYWMYQVRNMVSVLNCTHAQDVSRSCLYWTLCKTRCFIALYLMRLFENGITSWNTWHLLCCVVAHIANINMTNGKYVYEIQRALWIIQKQCRIQFYVQPENTGGDFWGICKFLRTDVMS